MIAELVQVYFLEEWQCCSFNVDFVALLKEII